MHSGELASLAGVTVRALRHWHQVGVLPEPERRRNGYREYGVADLVRVLRINRLAALGMPLERMAEVLDSEASGGRASTSGLLEQLDGELAEQIERLERQRGLIALVRRHDASPDVPPELAPVAAALIAAGLSSPMARFDRDQSVLLAHLAGRDGLSRLVDFFERLVEPDRTAAVTIVMNRFGGLDEESSETEVDDVVAALTELSVELSVELAACPVTGSAVGGGVDAAPATAPIDLGAAAPVIGAYAADVLNDTQRRVLDRVGAALDAASPTS